MDGTHVRWQYPEDVVGPDPDKPLPYNTEAEQAVLGALAISREALPLVTGIITPEHFTREVNARLYELILGAYEDGAEAMHPDMVTIQLAKRGLQADPGEIVYFWNVLESEGTWRNAGYWAAKLHDAYMRRRIVLAGLCFTRKAQDESAHPADLFFQAVEMLSLTGDYAVPSGERTNISYEDLLKDDVPPVRWVVDRLLPARGLTMIAGDPGVGKSWVCYHLAQCVASGQPFLGHFPVSRTGVLMVDAEGSENLVHRRLRKLHNGLFGPDVSPGSRNVPLLLLPNGIRLDDPKSEELLSAEIRRGEAGLVVIDPLVMTHSQDENSSTEMAKVFQALKRIGERTECAFLLVHHVRKQSMASNQAAQRLRGSTAILGFLDSYLFLRQVRTGRISVEHAKSRHAEPVEDFVIELTDPDEATTLLTYAGESKDAPDKAHAALDFILRTLADNGGQMKRQEILEQAKGEGIPERTVTRALREAVDLAQIGKARQGQNTFYSLPPALIDLD